MRNLAASFLMIGFMSVFMTALSAVPAAADVPIGARVGFTDWDNISQVHFGLDARLGEIAPNVEFTPNVELGLGDDATIFTVNGDVTYQFTELVASPWGLYGGGALSLHHVSIGSHDDTDLGLNLLLGGSKVLANGHLALAEVRVGILDSADFKITFGYSLF